MEREGRGEEEKKGEGEGKGMEGKNVRLDCSLLGAIGMHYAHLRKGLGLGLGLVIRVSISIAKHKLRGYGVFQWRPVNVMCPKTCCPMSNKLSPPMVDRLFVTS